MARWHGARWCRLVACVVGAERASWRSWLRNVWAAQRAESAWSLTCRRRLTPTTRRCRCCSWPAAFTDYVLAEKPQRSADRPMSTCYFVPAGGRGAEYCDEHVGLLVRLRVCLSDRGRPLPQYTLVTNTDGGTDIQDDDENRPVRIGRFHYMWDAA